MRNCVKIAYFWKKKVICICVYCRKVVILQVDLYYGRV